MIKKIILVIIIFFSSIANAQVGVLPEQKAISKPAKIDTVYTFYAKSAFESNIVMYTQETVPNGKLYTFFNSDTTMVCTIFARNKDVDMIITTRLKEIK